MVLQIDGETLTIDNVVRVSRQYEQVVLACTVHPAIMKSRDVVNHIIKKKKPVYGVNTGFGELASISIETDRLEELQSNLIRSHSCGTGDPLSEDVTRAIMVLRLNSLAKGYSGVRYELLEMLVAALNRRFYPCVPSKGSVGASGDLVPLSHIALALMGEGEAFCNGSRVTSRDVLSTLGITPLSLKAKEGLAFINGTQFMAGMGCLVAHDTVNLLKNAQIAAIMSLEALNGTDQAFREEISRARPHEGQRKVTKNLWKLTRDSRIIASHKECPMVQDAYSLRCMPQIFGAFYDMLEFAKTTFTTEINSATDNPLIFENDIVSGGNFHGEPLAIALDMLAILLAKLSSFSERRCFRLLDDHLSGLPAFLTKTPGLNSGLMILQYVAAALTSENKTMAYPASVDSIPTSANKEDYQSMGSISALKCMKLLANARRVVAIEYLLSSQGLDFKSETPAPATAVANTIIRKHVPFIENDRPLYREIEIITECVRNGSIVAAVENKIGMLH